MRVGRVLDQASRWEGALALCALAVILGLLFASPGAWPGGLLDKADHAAFGVCHRIPERTFWLAGRPLPLCARCSGLYLGAFAGLIVLLARRRGCCSGFPVRRYWPVLGVFVLAWAGDGLNSYLTLFPGMPYLYEPNNIARLVTGTLQGLVLSVLLLPVLNLAFWRDPDSRPVLDRWPDLAWLLAGGGLVITAVSSGWDLLLYPLALLSGALIVFLVGGVNAILLLTIVRRDGKAVAWRELAVPILLGTALALVELTTIGLIRAELTARYALPF